MFRSPGDTSILPEELVNGVIRKEIIQRRQTLVQDMLGSHAFLSGELLWLLVVAAVAGATRAARFSIFFDTTERHGAPRGSKQSTLELRKRSCVDSLDARVRSFEADEQ